MCSRDPRFFIIGPHQLTVASFETSATRSRRLTGTLRPAFHRASVGEPAVREARLREVPRLRVGLRRRELRVNRRAYCPLELETKSRNGANGPFRAVLERFYES